MGASPLNIETVIRDGEQTGGYRSTIAMQVPPLELWRVVSTGSSMSASAGNTAYITTVANFVNATFRQDSIDAVRISTRMCQEYAFKEQFLKLRALARKVDASDENADLALQGIFRWIATDGSAQSETLTVTLPASAADPDFTECTFDFGAAIRAKNAAGTRAVNLNPFPGCQCSFTIGPNELVGSADMVMQVRGCVQVEIGVHCGIWPYSWSSALSKFVKDLRKRLI